MRPLRTAEIAAAFVNTSRSQRAKIAAPPQLDQQPWDDLDYLGWRDPKAPARGYLLTERDETLVGLAVQTASSGAGGRGSAVCDLCLSAHARSDVALFTARRAGPAGRKGDTVGVYICADLACSLYIRGLRRLELPQGETLDPAERSARLRRRLDAFIDRAVAA